VLSEVNDCATSGAFPPRIAATILSSFVPPITLTWIPGFLVSKSLTTFLNVISSGSTNGVQIVMFAGSTFVVELDVELADLLEPPHPVTVSMSSTPNASKTRLIPLLRSG